MKKPTGLSLFCTGVIALAFLFASRVALPCAAADAATALRQSEDPLSSDSPASTNTPGEVHFSQQAIDQLRREIEQSAARNAEAITSSLSLIEPTLALLH